MAVVTGPFFSLDARGSLGKTLVASYWRGVNYLRKRVVPHNPNTVGQQAIRQVITDGSSKWRFGIVTEGQKGWWNTYAKGLAESGINRFIRAYVRDNYADEAVVSPQVIPDPE